MAVSFKQKVQQQCQSIGTLVNLAFSNSIDSNRTSVESVCILVLTCSVVYAAAALTRHNS